MFDKQPVVLSDRRRRERVFDEVVVKPCERVILVRHEHLPMVEQIAARLPELRLRQRLSRKPGDHVGRPAQRSSEVLPPLRRTRFTHFGLVPLAFES